MNQAAIPRPFLKWAGGKKQLLQEIQPYYPQQGTIQKYCEPFVGGGAVFFDVVTKCAFEHVYISDTNAELINAYLVVRDKVEDVIALLQQMTKDYLALSGEERAAYYYTQREQFNELKQKKAEGKSVNRAALFLFLNRTCFNGLYRENSKGLFNVPVGRYKNPIICDPENLLCVGNTLKNVTIHCGDYTDAISFIDCNTFVYFDPPYRPLSGTSSFTSYNQSGFDDGEQVRLAGFIKEINQKGAQFLLSNSDPCNTNPEDDFFDKLYQNYTIKRVPAKRMINSKSDGRGVVSELLISSNTANRKANVAFQEDSSQ